MPRKLSVQRLRNVCTLNHNEIVRATFVLYMNIKMDVVSKHFSIIFGKTLEGNVPRKIF